MARNRWLEKAKRLGLLAVGRIQHQHTRLEPDRSLEDNRATKLPEIRPQKKRETSNTRVLTTISLPQPAAMSPPALLEPHDRTEMTEVPVMLRTHGHPNNLPLLAPIG